MKILVLGSRGNLGSLLVKSFRADDEIIGWDQGDIDITDKGLITKKINDIKPNIVINAAAHNGVDTIEESDEVYEMAKKINSEAPGYLADAVMGVNGLLIHYSTDYVFDGSKKEGYDENDETRPISKYAETKLLGEKAIISREGKGLRYYIIRTSKLFGPKGDNKNAKPSFFDLMLELSEKKDKISVVDEEMSCFTYTHDLAEATFELIESRKGNGIYHIVNSGPCTWHDAVKELFRIKDIKTEVLKVTSEDFPRPAKRPKYSVLNNNKFAQLRDWKEALKEYIN